MRPSRLLVLPILVVSIAACSKLDVTTTEVSRTEVVAALIDQGLDARLAECTVGLGEREFDLADLAPGADLEPNEQALIAELVLSCEGAAAILDTDPVEPEQLAFDSGLHGLGDDARLDALWTGCERGDGAACDRLWELAPIDSAYEDFGVTCGGRPDLLDCTKELVLESPEGE